MRLLIFLIALLGGLTPAWAVGTNVYDFARRYAPPYAQSELQQFYNESDATTRKAIVANWPRMQREMDQAGIPRADQPALFRILYKESTWDHTKKNPTSSAVGYCGTMLSAHGHTVSDNFRNDPIEQLQWCHAYAMERYGNYRDALLHHKQKNWW